MKYLNITQGLTHVVKTITDTSPCCGMVKMTLEVFLDLAEQMPCKIKEADAFLVLKQGSEMSCYKNLQKSED